MALKTKNETDALNQIEMGIHRLHGLATLLNHMVEMSEDSTIDFLQTEMNFIIMTIDRTSEEISDSFHYLVQESVKRGEHPGVTYDPN